MRQVTTIGLFTEASRRPLEAPLGVFLLYDEIWFLHRALCPKNMRSLTYVRFLDDECEEAEITSLARELQPSDPTEASRFRSLASNTYVHKWTSSPIHPGPRLVIGGRAMTASPLSLDALIFDTAVATNLRLDLVVNSLAASAVKELSQANRQARLVTLVLGDGFPNLYGKWGPYRPGLRHIVDYLRSGYLLAQYRTKILEACEARSEAPVARVADELKVVMRHLVEEKFLEHFRKERPFYALANLTLGQIEPPRVVRRVHFLRGGGAWDDDEDTHQGAGNFDSFEAGLSRSGKR